MQTHGDQVQITKAQDNMASREIMTLYETARHTNTHAYHYGRVIQNFI